MDRNIKCLHCGNNMQYIQSEKIQLGQTGWLLGDLSNLLSGALEVEIYTCSECGKIEFFKTESDMFADQIEQKKCPNCGKKHDFDYAKCPYCKHDYYA